MLDVDRCRYVKPGTGHLEHVEIDWQPRSEPAPFPEEAQPYELWWKCMEAASLRSGYTIACPSPQDTEQHLENAGFVDITRRKIRLPLGQPRDVYEWNIQRYYRALLGGTEEQAKTFERLVDSSNISFFSTFLPVL